MLESYQSIREEVETIIVQKKSKFICSMKAVSSEEEALLFVNTIKKKYYDAKHHCLAYSILEKGDILDRVNDDGEPSGTAGKPMLEVIRGAGLHNVVAVVTRYFGGILLGTGGLIKAYTQSIQSTLQEAKVYEKVLCEKLMVTTDYSTLPKIEYFMRGSDHFLYKTDYSDQVDMTLLIKKAACVDFKAALIEMTNGQCAISEQGLCFVSHLNHQIQLEDCYEEAR